MGMRVAFLGPAGTFSEDALLAAVGDADIEPLPRPSVYAAIRAVGAGEADRALVPFENSIEGGVRSTLDTLAFDGEDVMLAGEHDHVIRHSLIARTDLPLERIAIVLSHPQASAQCARFIRERLPDAGVRAAESTADAVRTVAATDEPWAALGAASAARIYGCVVLREGVEDNPDNVTRFVWIAPAGTKPGGQGPWRTSLVFAELGADHPGALVEALTEFSSRDVNLTRIESRPLRQGLGRYMFFCDLEGSQDDPAVTEAIDALRGKAESVRILGSYPIAANGIPGT
ncbi:MAG TPA: prephenate dehydratase [Solirubrobacterales bacterium]|nr:prephenate dehydratase [Solirubrobacterales bacterium]